MYPRDRINIEIFRDAATSDVPVDKVVLGLYEAGEIISELNVINNNRRVNIGPRRRNSIDTNRLSLPRIRSDMGMIVTSRRLLVPNQDGKIQRGNIVVGSTWPYADKPFSILDAGHGMSPLITAKHEFGHLMQIPRGGETFDGDCHCTNENCVMHAIINLERNDYCSDCKTQLGASALRLIALKSDITR